MNNEELCDSPQSMQFTGSVWLHLNTSKYTNISIHYSNSSYHGCSPQCSYIGLLFILIWTESNHLPNCHQHTPLMSGWEWLFWVFSNFSKKNISSFECSGIQPFKPKFAALRSNTIINSAHTTRQKGLTKITKIEPNNSAWHYQWWAGYYTWGIITYFLLTEFKYCHKNR